MSDLLEPNNAKVIMHVEIIHKDGSVDKAVLIGEVLKEDQPNGDHPSDSSS